jgi:2,5-dioxopentanoate dehydrogenase
LDSPDRERPEPIVVYAEMGSVNPVVLLPGALRERGPSIAEGLHASFTQGTGQFCTNPGLVFAPAGNAGDVWLQQLGALTRATPAGIMLSRRTCANYREGLARLRSLGAELVAEGAAGQSVAAARAAVWQVGASAFLGERGLVQEVFGPSTLIVRYGESVELAQLLRALDGQLTASVFGVDDELLAHAPLFRVLAGKVGRLVVNQFPTGVEVNHAMVHGGPFPATSDGRSTSVGTRAIDRFTRLVAFQNFPDQALPDELKAANPRGIFRLVNGIRTRDPVAEP